MRRIGEDPAALEIFYRTHVRTIERFMARRCSTPHSVADLTADTFVAAIESAHRFDPTKGSPQSWLLGIAYRVVLAERRRAARSWRAHLREGGRLPLSEDAILALEERLDSEGAYRSIREALVTLTPRDRTLLELRWVDQLSIEEISTTLGIPAGTARVRLHRARQRLHDNITQLRDRNGPDETTPSALRKGIPHVESA